MHARLIHLWTVWFLASFFYAYQYVLRVLPNLMMPEILERFSIDANLFGQYSGIYYISYALMHIPLGMLLDRVGPKKILPVAIILTVSGLLPLIYAEEWIYPLLGRFLMGMGSSAAILGVFKIIRMSFKERYFSRMLGFSVMIGLLGAIYGGAPVHFLFSEYGSEAVLKFFIFIGLFLALMLYLMVPKMQKAETDTDPVALHSLWQILSNKKVLLICVLGGLMVGPLEGFADVWGSEYLKVKYGFDASTASFLPSLIFLGMCFGAPFLSYIAERANAYYRMIILAAAFMAITFTALLWGLLSLFWIQITFTLVGLFSAYQILVIYKTTTYVSKDHVGLTTAIANMIIMLFGYFFHSMIGWVMNSFWDGKMFEGRPLYSELAFSNGLAVIPMGLFASVIGFSLIYWSETKKR